MERKLNSVFVKLTNDHVDRNGHVSEVGYLTVANFAYWKICEQVGLLKLYNHYKISGIVFDTHMEFRKEVFEGEEVMINLAKSIRKEYNINNLCLAGGVALNCVANGKVLKEKIFDNIWIQPAAGDAGGSLGAALALWHIDQGNKRSVNLNDDMKGSYLGTEFNQDEIEKELKLSLIHI